MSSSWKAIWSVVLVLYICTGNQTNNLAFYTAAKQVRHFRRGLLNQIVFEDWSKHVRGFFLILVSFQWQMQKHIWLSVIPKSVFWNHWGKLQLDLKKRGCKTWKWRLRVWWWRCESAILCLKELSTRHGKICRNWFSVLFHPELIDYQWNKRNRNVTTSRSGCYKHTE